MAICGATVPDKTATGDAFYGASICGQQYVDYFWYTYGFTGTGTTWQSGFGYEDCCNTDLPLARAFNGCYVLTYSATDYLNDDYAGACLNWARRYVRENIKTLSAKCDGPSGAVAQNPGGSGDIEVYKPFFYTKNAPGRAETLLHESRHCALPHNAKFPKGSTFGEGKDGADSNWAYNGAWMYGALYLWWYYAQGARTTSALRELARQRGNVVIDGAFAEHPGYSI
jgi:hypothetical protein